MKFNWGTGIVIAFGIFIVFILSFVFRVQSNPKYDNELVTKEYYKKEATVQNDINKQEKANALEHRLVIKKTDDGILVIFPENFEAQNISGKVSLYRPSNQKLDFEIPISLSSPHLLIPKSSLVGGLWDITVDWTYQSTDYLNKETIYF
ncbi:FixH family protein [Flavobacterium sp. NRK F10]|uniref:Cytochrome C oxidase Cbb3 n=1 Tax=Flavobacterium sediminis TaxID=2201181 RepID=A0A2U8QYF4_9FLAO|nr:MULTISPECIES: FixH family protein [Flavobacterium]AWM14845.1 cytochrome C oxidase Cbb3 [Flavobacterium sediminis]MCO6176087.1 FixH family protein [Flavobacterium sp. NRK F10]